MPESTKTYINGPINTVRLEGKINNVKKVIYLFMDIHEPTGNETECDDILSRDVKDYLVDKFQHVNDGKMIDFFLEAQPSHIPSRKLHEYKENYINNLITLFSKAFQKSEKGQAVVNKLFPTIRFHHIDPRDYFEWTTYSAFNGILNSVDTVWKSKYILSSDLNYLSNKIEEINQWLSIIYTYFFKTDIDTLKDIIAKRKPIVPKSAEDKSRMTFEDVSAQTFSLIKKVKSRYEHKDVMKGVNAILNNHVKKSYDAYSKLDKERVKLFNGISKELVDYLVFNNSLEHPNWGTSYDVKLKAMLDVELIFEKMFDEYMNFFVGLMDVYFIRRFLDKDYITNVVAYTGALHSLNYIFYLVKYFDFKVTDFSYANPEIKDYNKQIRNAKSPNELGIIFYPPILKQCSDLTGFPKNFD